LHLAHQVFVAGVGDVAARGFADDEALALQVHAEPVAEGLGVDEGVPDLAARGRKEDLAFDAVAACAGAHGNSPWPVKGNLEVACWSGSWRNATFRLRDRQGRRMAELAHGRSSRPFLRSRHGCLACGGLISEPIGLILPAPVIPHVGAPSAAFSAPSPHLHRGSAMTSRLFGTALVLGLLSAVGPFAIDMYLPALPGIQRGLHTDVDAAQMSLMAFFAAIAAGQVIYGPVSDMLGRKPPIYFGLCLFAVASIGCALAPDIHSLIACRFVQGLGACAGMVIPRAIVRDMHTGTEVAPLTGSLVIRLASWRGIFWVVAAAAVLGLALAVFVLKETRTNTQRVESSLRSVLVSYRTLLRDRPFLGLVFIGAFGISSFFT